MDYERFLVSRMKEEHAHGADAKDAIVSDFHHGGRVVAASAIIMISVFASFALIDDRCVFADAFLVRMILVPAVMALVGERMWWFPKWLDRILPNLDLEGETLTKHLGRGPKSAVGERSTESRTRAHSGCRSRLGLTAATTNHSGGRRRDYRTARRGLVHPLEGGGCGSIS